MNKIMLQLFLCCFVASWLTIYFTTHFHKLFHHAINSLKIFLNFVANKLVFFSAHHYEEKISFSSKPHEAKFFISCFSSCGIFTPVDGGNQFLIAFLVCSQKESLFYSSSQKRMKAIGIFKKNFYSCMYEKFSFSIYKSICMKEID